MAKAIKEEKIEKMMKSLELTREEAIELIQFDNGEVESQEEKKMTAKAKPIAKAMASVSRKPKEEKPKMAGVTTQTRKRKEDLTKQMIIANLDKSLAEMGEVENLEISNIEKTIKFTIGEESYEVDLKKKRKVKK